MVTREQLADAHAHAAAEVCAALGTDATGGLSEGDARDRLAACGPNVLSTAPPVPGWRKFLAQFESPLVLLLLAAAAVSLAVWGIEDHAGVPHEALTILAIVAMNAVLGFFQEERAARAVAGLAKMSAATAVVFRDGARRSIPAADLVPGDLIVVEEGMTIPADARIVRSVSLKTSEAALTGESAAIDKLEAPVPEEASLGDRLDMIYAGTVAVFGHGLAVVTATGMTSEFGKIATLLHATTPEPTPLQKELERLGRILGAIVIAIAIIVGATILALQQDITTAVLVGVLLYTVSLAVSAVPEGLAAVTTVVLSLGMQRMARRKAIVRRLAAVETLGSATVIASDKTGTLTQNEMTVRAIVTASGRVDLSGTGYGPEGALSTARAGWPPHRGQAPARRGPSGEQRGARDAGRPRDGHGRSHRGRAQGGGAQGRAHGRVDPGTFHPRRRAAVLGRAQADEHRARRRHEARRPHPVREGRARRAARAVRIGARGRRRAGARHVASSRHRAVDRCSRRRSAAHAGRRLSAPGYR